MNDRERTWAILHYEDYDRLPVVLCEPGQVGGRTYCKAQGVFAVKTFPLKDGRVRVEIVLELHHGDATRRWVSDQGVLLRLEAGRCRHGLGRGRMWGSRDGHG